MRAFALILLSMSLAVLPLLANDAKDAGTEESRAATAADRPKETTKSENAIMESEIQDLRSLVEEQKQELEAQRAALKAQQSEVKALEEKLAMMPSELANNTVAASLATSEVTSAAEIGVTPQKLSTAAAIPAQGAAEEKASPLYFKIGGAEFYPLGFMELMNTTRTTNLGGIATTFSGIPFGNTVAGRLSEDRLSLQYSRIGLRTHAKFGEADVTGYIEADFLGYQPANAYITTNNDTLRLRLYWVDYKRSKFELLGGQTWTLLNPNRVGVSPMPGDIFYSQDVDPNLQLGLTWLRQAGIRLIAHPNDNWAIAVAAENPEQTLPSSVCVPPVVSGSCSTAYASQFDTISSNTSNATAATSPNTPNLHPDIITKVAFDAMPDGHQVHFELAGLFRTFKAVNVIGTPSPITASDTVYSTTHGGGVSAVAYVELVKNFRIITTAFYSDGGARYIANITGPDVVVRPNGTISPVRAGSGIGGFEYQVNPKTMIYGYYSGVYLGKNYQLTGTTYSGYGYPGSPNTDNRYLYEPTFGVHYTFWRNANYGDIRFLTQYSYVSRTPWYVAPGTPATAHTSMIYLDMRYDLP